MKVFVVVILVLLACAKVSLAQATQPANSGEIIRRDPGTTASGGSLNSGPSATRVALSLAGVLALIVVLAVVAKKIVPRGKFGGGVSSGDGAIHVLARTALGPKQRVVLLQVGRKILVLGDCDGHPLSTLCEIGDFDEAAALISQLQADGGSKSFTAALESAMERFRAAERDAAEPRRSSESIDAMRQEIEGLAQRVRGMAR
jgi:flagellar biogenesis protein FliO